MQDAALSTTQAGSGNGAPAPSEPRAVKQRAVRRVMIAFIAMMIILTLFSRTLLQFTLPQVTLELPAAGALTHDISGSGTITTADVSQIYANSDTRWPVAEVKVKTGDRVKAGDTLITFDTQDGRNALADEQAHYRQQQLALGRLQDDFVTAQHNADESQTRTISRNIESAQLDMQIQQRKIDTLQKQLKDGASIRTPVSGIVTVVNASPGIPIQGGGPAVTVADLSKPVLLKVILPEEQVKYLSVGDETDVTASALGLTSMKGKISAIGLPEASGQTGQSSQQAATPDSKEVRITLSDNRLNGGEYADFSISKRTKPVPVLVSNGAVRHDNDADFVLVLQKKRGVFGDEYFAQQVKVITGESDDTRTQIKSGINKMDRIIVSSSSPVADGDQIRLAD